MKVEKLDKVKNEAIRFLGIVARYEKTWPVGNYGYGDFREGGNKESAAVRRASLDLTRALAEYRKVD